MTTVQDRQGWRVVDIVVAAVIAVAFGVVFVAWNALWSFTTPLFAAAPPLQAIIYGVWLLPGVLVGLIVRRPGAALMGGIVSAAVSALIGSQWGADAIISGALQGGGAELGFALGLYRRWNLPFAMLAGALAGVAAGIHDVIVYYANFDQTYQVAFGVATTVSGIVLAGIGAWWLLRALIGTGVLRDFAVGRDQRQV
jgi:energy-coupling factor transport system permease protein